MGLFPESTWLESTAITAAGLRRFVMAKIQKAFSGSQLTSTVRANQHFAALSQPPFSPDRAATN